MKNLNSLIVASLISVVSTSVMAQAKDEHAGHHPEPASQTETPKVNTPPNQVSQDMMEKMDGQIKAMQEIHQKMINAKSTEERSAIMTENMKAMQSAMSMMRDAGMMGMSMKEGMPMKDVMSMKDGMPMMEGMHMQHQLMQKRMEMMTNMMQMMMDQMSTPKSK